MSNAFDHLHIKRHTAGSSNELSFDVLDAARDSSNAKKGHLFGRQHREQREARMSHLVQRKSLEKRQKVPQAPISDSLIDQKQPEPEIEPSSLDLAEQRIGPASYHRASGKLEMSSSLEVANRKRQRRARSIRLAAIAAIAAIAIMVATVYAGYQNYERMQLFKGKFDNLIELFVQADEVLPLADTFMKDPFGATTQEVEQLQQTASQSNLILQQLAVECDLAREYIVNEQDEQALNNISDAITNRQSMIQASLSAVDIVGNSNVESSEVNAVWHRVLGVDEQVRTATAAANAADSDEAIGKAREQTLAAQEDLKDILKEMQAFEKTRNDLDLSEHISYLQARIDSLDHAIATSDALLKADKEKASSENEAYNEADKKAAALADQLPLSAEQNVEQAYENNVAACKTDYDDARNRAIQSDLLIRQYLRVR